MLIKIKKIKKKRNKLIQKKLYKVKFLIINYEKLLFEQLK